MVHILVGADDRLRQRLLDFFLPAVIKCVIVIIIVVVCWQLPHLCLSVRVIVYIFRRY